MKTIPLTQGKKCWKCLNIKPISEFNKCTTTTDGLQGMCKPCHKKYREKTKVHRQETNKQWKLKNPSAGRTAQKKYRTIHREKVLKSAREYAQRTRKENPHKHHLQDRKLALMKNYGITFHDYDMLLQKQHGVCAVCGAAPSNKRKYLCVDHDHKTSKVRSLLCNRCNVILGLANDDKSILELLINYLSIHQAALNLHGEFAHINPILTPQQLCQP